ncbi:MAG TPA: OsmC family protein [Mucilaginibacter sp.]|nr:OsmC family protein [Mucilaginibacter sp.]
MQQEQEKIKSAFSRVSGTFAQRPSFGLGTGISKATIKNGLTCEIKEGNWTLMADMSVQAGGNAGGPTPGVYGRAALGSCLAIGYMMRAAVMGIPVAGLEVEIQADYDDGPLFGTAAPDVPPGYLDIRYSVTIDSDAPEEDIMRMLDEADKHSPYLDVFSRAQTCMRQVNIVTAKQD